MKPDRREFIKFVVAGSIAAGCPVDKALLAESAPSPQVDGESNTICHEVRDGHKFPSPSPTKHCGVAIIGGGVSGLSAAYFLRDSDFLILEKEDHWGGNAYEEQFDGQGFATGAAFDNRDSESDKLMRELGLTQLPVNCPDPSIINGTWIADTWGKGIDTLPYPAAVRDSFRKFKETAMAVDVEKNYEQLDNEPFTKYLRGFSPEVKQWWDGYGPSNWGAKSADTSAMVGLGAMQDIVESQTNDSRVTLPGGNGCVSKKLSEVMLKDHADQMLGGATIVSVEPGAHSVKVTYIRDGRAESLSAKAVIMATPKFITSRIVSGLPEAQRDAMQQIRYAPYPVVNLIFDKPVYNKGYDTWCPGNTFTDFIVADWVMLNQPGYKQKNNILTFYTPLPTDDRSRLLTVESCRALASRVMRDFQKLTPDFKVDPVEIHLYRRGHPMFMATPGTFSQHIPAARKPMSRVFFANTDSVGPESLTANSVKVSSEAADWARKRIAS